MPDPELLVGILFADPVLSYSLLAAIFLAAVSLVAGLSRLDFAALAAPRAALACGLCVALAVLLKLLVYGDPLGAPFNDPSAGLAPPLAGIERFPLLLAALAYGPTPGLLVAALYSAFGPHDAVPLAAAAVLGLEVALAGWLAIFPSPREHRWAGPANAVIAYLLAWTTGSLALAQWRSGELSVANMLALNPGTWGGVLASAFLLLLVAPHAYQWLFPHSRIDVGTAEGSVVIEPLAIQRSRRKRELTEPALPGRDAGRRRRRRLAPEE